MTRTKLKDRVLLVDLLEYVLPTGYTYNIGTIGFFFSKKCFGGNFSPLEVYHFTSKDHIYNSINYQRHKK